MDDIVAIANLCFIFHNLTLRMQQNGNFREELEGDKLISEFLTADEQGTSEAENEYVDNQRRIQYEGTMDWEVKLAR